MGKDNLETLDRLQRMDHDTLIRLESKVDALILEVKQMQESSVKAIADHEIRIRAIEKVVESADVETSLKTLKDVAKWQQDFSFRWKFIIGGAVALGAFVSWALRLVLDYLKIN